MQNADFFDFARVKAFFTIQNIKKCLFVALFAKKKHIRKRSNFCKNHVLTPLQNVDFFDFARTLLFRSKKYSFLFRISKIVSFWLSLLKRTHRKRSILWEKPWTNPFAKCQFFSTLWELHFWGPKSFIFYPEYQKMFLSAFFCSKKKHIRKRSIFWQKPWTNPFAKCRFFWLC